MKKTIVFLLIACMLAALCGCGKEPDTIEGSGFDSPEKAVMAYVQALTEGDVNGIISTFAIETYVDNYDLEKHMEFIRVYSPSMWIMGIDSDDAYTRNLNLIDRQYQISKNLTNMYMYLGNVEYTGTPITFNGNPYAEPSELMDDLVIDDWMEMLAEIKIGGVLKADDLSVDITGLEKALESRIHYLNCDELIPLAVEVTIDGVDYYLCVDVACYDGTWYNCAPRGIIADLLGAEVNSGGLAEREY